MKSCPICTATDLICRPERLRDSDRIGVLECRMCSHVFLDNFSHVTTGYYESGAILLNKPFASNPDERRRHYRHENELRTKRIAQMVTNKRVLDFGCGNGQLLEMVAPLTKSIEGVEPTQTFRLDLAGRGFDIKSDVSECRGPYDVIYSFHVFEHVPEPVEMLSRLNRLLTPNGTIFLELPNVNDALVSLYAQPEAQRFHFFLNHLHYFSRNSLMTAIRRAGLVVEAVTSHQRFSLANHLYWLRHGKPNGHVIWDFLDSEQLSACYDAALAAADMSDSLVAVARVPRK